jgi:hypothetical protein
MRNRLKMCVLSAGVAFAIAAPTAAATEAPKPHSNGAGQQIVGSDISLHTGTRNFQAKQKHMTYKPQKWSRSALATNPPMPRSHAAKRLVGDFDAGRITSADFVRTALTLQQRAAFPGVQEVRRPDRACRLDSSR